ncbi:phosphoenolpyruvate carboxykinase (GTP) [Desulfatirhabdium butyrativorans]|uniref:phosphoenolpyruvate carboxykinase (GTP) n=1 Tax=Desulfatirhabdium butyrativorans TaxID=340467 RepID=UPI00040E2422|nr:phosphoenolpyruvate carboxykinase (GTP) [Desulfatirhabdium butyrativorans]
MFFKNQGVDIVTELGNIRTAEQADSLFRTRMDAAQYNRMQKLKHPQVLLKIANTIAMADPDRIFVNTGTEEDRQFIRELALQTGEEAKLAMPDHTIHFDLKEEQGRIIDRTFYIANPGEHVSTLANHKNRDEALVDIREKMQGIMRGKTLIVGCYVRGPAGSPVSNPALELTSSAYVAHSAELLYRNHFQGFDEEVARQGHFFTNIHSQGLNRAEDLPHARVYMDRSYWTTYSFNCTYAGNTLLLKKGNHRFCVDKAVYENRGKELSEHMFITGIQGPKGRETWIIGAAPSGCGKTTTAMAGDLFVGDDLAQVWIAADGSVRAVNPENGIFGILEDVNWEGDPKLMELLRKPGVEVIWSNVLVDDAGVPHWRGNGEPVPESGINFQGPWKKGMVDAKGKPVPISHPNSRCTLRSSGLANYSPKAQDPAGVEVRIITYSGRDSNTMPPVWVGLTPDHGVVIGACIVSAATATEVGATGVKRAPWANAPFIPGALGDYMEAQFQFFNNPAINPEKQPIMAGLNYFLTHESRGGIGKGLLGEKRDVKVWLNWLERLARKEVQAIRTPIGLIPRYEDLKALFAAIISKPYPEDLYRCQFSLYLDHILDRIDMQMNAYRKEINLPPRLFEILEAEKRELLEWKGAHGAIVVPWEIQG